jgi:4-alpha-glucanotransferase
MPAIEKVFLNSNPDGTFSFKPEFATERSLCETELSEEDDTLRSRYRDELLRLLAEVLLIKVSETDYRPRPLFAIAASTRDIGEKSFSFGDLPSYQQSPFVRLEEEYRNNKQRVLWISKAREILSEVTRGSRDATFFSDASGSNIELCGETLKGVVIMPLRVQIEGRNDALFDDIRGYPYLSVASPQRDCSIPLRVLGEEGRIDRQKLWHDEFWENGEAPEDYSDEVAECVMQQHCWSGSVWIMFPIDCLIGAKKYIVASDHLKYGKLDLKKFFGDQEVEKSIRDVLDRTKRRC